MVAATFSKQQMVLAGIQAVNSDLETVKNGINNAITKYKDAEFKDCETQGCPNGCSCYGFYTKWEDEFKNRHLKDSYSNDNNAGKVYQGSIPAYNENFYPLEVSYTLPGLNIKTTSNSININK